MSQPQASSTRGILCAAGAYTLWGLLPLYWKLVKTVPADQILLHRIVWSFVAISLLMWGLGRLKTTISKLRDKKILLTFIVSALLISGNWLTYIWAVNSGHTLEASLGYFIAPLINVALGVFLLKEKLNRLQLAAMVLASIAVGILTVHHGNLPWIAIVLALSFTLYGYIRKISKVGSLEGLFLETLLLSAPGAIMLYSFESSGNGYLLNSGVWVLLLLILAGPVTALPLLLFAEGARNIRMTTLGLMQFISPSLQFLLAVLVFKEPFDQVKFIAFSLIWLALVLYSLSSYRTKAT